MKQPNANKALLLLVWLHMLRKPSRGSRWWQHLHATLIRPARFLAFKIPVKIYSPLVPHRRSARSSEGDPLLCWQGFVMLLLIHYVTMMLPWKRIPNRHQQGIQQWKPLVWSQTVFRRMTSEFPENTDLWTTSATCYAYFSEQLESINWYTYLYIYIKYQVAEIFVKILED